MKNEFDLTKYFSAIILIICLSCNLSPGSYPYAEIYEIENNQSNLILAIEKFKEENADICVPKQVGLKDGRRFENDHWYHVYFYYKDENKIVKTWIRQKNNKLTQFAFVGINEGLLLGNWKDINKDFSKNENKIQKKKFEEAILNNIKNDI